LSPLLDGYEGLLCIVKMEFSSKLSSEFGSLKRSIAQRILTLGELVFPPRYSVKDFRILKWKTLIVKGKAYA
jgi:hypothetical protein